MSIEHYENFPVASWLCPPALRPAVLSIYHYARTADDLADEGDATPEQRLIDLAEFRADLLTVARRGRPSPRWPWVFGPLAATLDAHRLPLVPLTDLLDAFEQDVVQHRYASRTELLDYCRRSAAPVGRLLLHLYGIDAPEALRRSDAICTALQLANFWQDLSIDTARGRLYVPLEDAARHGLDAASLLARHDSAAARTFVRELVGWTRATLLDGAPLVHELPGRGGWELRLVVQGGLRILDRIRLLDHATLGVRPTLGARDAPLLLWRAAAMGFGRSPDRNTARRPT